MNVRQTTRLLTEDVDRLVSELHLSDEARAQAEAEALRDMPTHDMPGVYDTLGETTGPVGADGGYMGTVGGGGGGMGGTTMMTDPNAPLAAYNAPLFSTLASTGVPPPGFEAAPADPQRTLPPFGTTLNGTAPGSTLYASAGGMQPLQPLNATSTLGGTNGSVRSRRGRGGPRGPAGGNTARALPDSASAAQLDPEDGGTAA